jgi:hypothetical protein
MKAVTAICFVRFVCGVSMLSRLQPSRRKFSSLCYKTFLLPMYESSIGLPLAFSDDFPALFLVKAGNKSKRASAAPMPFKSKSVWVSKYTL